jgi:hypothetical protein
MLDWATSSAPGSAGLAENYAGLPISYDTHRVGCSHLTRGNPTPKLER